MEPRKPMGQKSSSRTVRQQFYETAVRLTGFPQEKCREILIESFGETFDLSKTAEYLALLREHAEDARLKVALDRRREALLAKLHKPIEVAPCQITGCTGHLYSEHGLRAVCSVGGLRHWLAISSSRWAGISPDEMLARIDAIAAVKAQEAEIALAAWREGISHPYEPQGWHILKEEAEATPIEAFETANA